MAAAVLAFVTVQDQAGAKSGNSGRASKTQRPEKRYHGVDGIGAGQTGQRSQIMMITI